MCSDIERIFYGIPKFSNEQKKLTSLMNKKIIENKLIFYNKINTIGEIIRVLYLPLKKLKGSLICVVIRY